MKHHFELFIQQKSLWVLHVHVYMYKYMITLPFFMHSETTSNAQFTTSEDRK